MNSRKNRRLAVLDRQLRLCTFLMVSSALLFSRTLAQEDGPWEGWTTVKLHETPQSLEPAITFLAAAPKIDGLLDAELAHLPPRPFNVVYRKKGDSVATAPPIYRLAYGTAFLYVQIEARAEGLTYRDRAYQMGDGFYMMLGKPREGDAPAAEFLCVACSAVNRQQNEWTRRVIWFNSSRDLFVPLSQEARLEFAEEDGKISFELLLPWAEVHPLHPWFMGDIAFNLTFVKAMPGNQREQRRYLVVPDPEAQSARWPKPYARMRAEALHPTAEVQTYVQLERNNIAQGTLVRATAASIGPAGQTESVTVRVAPGDRKSAKSIEVKYPCAGTLTRKTMELATADMPLGHYEAQWTASDGRSHSLRGLTVLPPRDIQEVQRRTRSVQKDIAPGSYSTLLLYLGELQEQMTQILSHETGEDVLQSLDGIVKILEQAEAGRDSIATQTGFFRRGFRSDLDGTIQPYAVQIPGRLRQQRRYPLVVFLHGSGGDERSLANFDFLASPRYIVIAPRARGTQNAYLPKEARQDIAEAIADAIANYPVDPEAVVLAGFSMGGYGAYRTFYDTPAKFRALAIFSGTPDVHIDYKREHGDGPNFLDEKHLGPFRDIPMFIFHGTEDLNCLFSETEALVPKLKAAGAKVEFVAEQGTGHSSPGYSAVRAYQQWLKRLLREDG